MVDMAMGDMPLTTTGKKRGCGETGWDGSSILTSLHYGLGRAKTRLEI
jgi:hypothetical protein